MTPTDTAARPAHTPGPCAVLVPNYGGYRFHACGNPGKIEQDGKWYCGIHNPVKRTAKAAATQLAYEQKFAMDGKRRQLANAAPDLLAALAEALSGGNHHPACRAAKPGHDILGRCDCWKHTARAAIAKAKGE